MMCLARRRFCSFSWCWFSSLRFDFGYSWFIGRKEANRLVHALNGNTTEEDSYQPSQDEDNEDLEEPSETRPLRKRVAARSPADRREMQKQLKKITDKLAKDLEARQKELEATAPNG